MLFEAKMLYLIVLAGNKIVHLQCKKKIDNPEKHKFMGRVFEKNKNRHFERILTIGTIACDDHK